MAQNHLIATDNYSVLIVDDHHMMRLGLKTLAQASSALPIDWLEAGNLADALDIYARNPQIQLVLLDLNLPDSQGLQGLRRFLSNYPDSRVAVFSATQDGFVVQQAIALGAMGFVPKSSTPEATLRLVESLLQGLQAVPDTMPSALPERDIGTPNLAARERAAKLSPTQLRVLELLLAGMSNQEIATELKLALGTIKNTVSSIMLIMDVHSRSHLSSVFR
jgi:DNA-binding NarL/FixJ family response regulator